MRFCRSLHCIAAAVALATVLTGCGRKGGLDAPPAFTSGYGEPAPTTAAVEPSPTGVAAPAQATAYVEQEAVPRGPATDIVPPARPPVPAASRHKPADGPFTWTPIDWLIN